MSSKENLNAEEVEFVKCRVSGAGCDLGTIIRLCEGMMANGGLSWENAALVEAIPAVAQRAGLALDDCLQKLGSCQVGGFDHYAPEVPPSAVEVTT